jgi:hypothetical protein
MQEIVPLPPASPPSRPSAFGRIIPVAMRSEDGNAFMAQARRVRTFLGIGGATGVMAAVPFVASGMTHNSLMTSLYAYGMCIIGTGVVMLFTPGEKPTPALPEGVDVRSLSILSREMIRISEEGLSDRDRLRVQRMIDDASVQVRHLLGGDAWTVAADPARSGTGIYVGGVKLGTPPKAETLGQKGVAIHRLLPEIDRSMTPGGTDPDMLRAAISWATPRIASICEDFGLDPVGFSERERILPGMRARALEQLPDLDAAARRMADEWLGGDREGVDPSLRIDADKAAGPELESLSRAWERARASATPDMLEAVDADMRDGCRRICATLSSAIGARGRSDRDALGIQTRYLESKHGGSDDVGDPRC